MGVPLRTALQLKSRWITPPVSSRIKLHNKLTDIRYTGAPGERIPTEHCGLMTISYDRLFVYDYLGLFCRRLRKGDSCTVYITPKPVSCGKVPDFTGKAVSGWRPKPGGGFSEHHELRQYRPGDNLNQIHWKLSAKTGTYIIREAMEPEKNRVLLDVVLRGSPAQLDEKCGKLVYMSKHLLELGLPHEIRALTGGGVEQLQITDEASLWQAVDRLLGCTSAPDDASLPPVAVCWQLSIGGDGGEA
jgi:uncharacterized protein (DUF58 family)